MSSPPAGAQAGKYAHEAAGEGTGANPTPANNSNAPNIGQPEYESTGPLDDVSHRQMPATTYFPSLSSQKQVDEQQAEHKGGHVENQEDYSFAKRKPGSKGLVGQLRDKLRQP